MREAHIKFHMDKKLNDRRQHVRETKIEITLVNIHNIYTYNMLSRV